MTRQCCVCRLVLFDAGPDAIITHTYCRLCAAALLRQMAIWDSWEED